MATTVSTPKSLPTPRQTIQAQSSRRHRLGGWLIAAKPNCGRIHLPNTIPCRRCQHAPRHIHTDAPPLSLVKLHHIIEGRRRLGTVVLTLRLVGSYCSCWAIAGDIICWLNLGSLLCWPVAGELPCWLIAGGLLCCPRLHTTWAFALHPPFLCLRKRGKLL